jgi:tetratricopeptide (TPR) repeat protein
MNEPDYYFFDGRTYRGPLPLSELRQYPTAPHHWYWTTGMSRWVPLAALPPAVPSAEPPPVHPPRPRPGGAALRSVGGGLMLGGLALQAARLLPAAPDWVTQGGFYAVQLVLYAGLLRLGQQARLLGVRVGAGLAALALVLEASQASPWLTDAPPGGFPAGARRCAGRGRVLDYRTLAAAPPGARGAGAGTDGHAAAPGPRPADTARADAAFAAQLRPAGPAVLGNPPSRPCFLRTLSFANGLKTAQYLLASALALLLGPGLTRAQDLTTLDNAEVKRLAQRRVEKGLGDLLNVLSLEDLTESERAALINESYATGVNQLFFSPDAIVEDDIHPARRSAGQRYDLSVEKYLANFDLLYQKSPEATVRLSDLVVSNLKRGQWYYVKVFYTQHFGGRHRQVPDPYAPVRRVAEVRADRDSSNRWRVHLVRVAFVAPEDSLNAALNDVALRAVKGRSLNLAAADSVAAEQERQEQAVIDAYQNLLGEGEAALRAGNLDDALRYFSEADRRKPFDDLTPRVRIARIQRTLDDRQQNAWQALALRAERARRQRQYPEAIRLYSQVLKQRPDSAALEPLLTGLLEKNRLKTEFDEKFAAGKYRDLLKEYGRIIDAERKQNKRSDVTSNSSDWYLGRGRCHFMLQADKDALGDYNEALRLDPQNLAAFGARAELYARQGQYPKAVADLTTCLTIDTASAENYVRRAGYRAQSRRYDEALADYAAAQRLDPRNAQWYQRQGLLHLQTRQHPAALQAFTEAVRRTTSQPEPYFYRGYTQVMLNQYAEAGSDFAQARERNLPDPYPARLDSIAEAFYQRALQLRNERQAVDALQTFANALLIKPDYAPAWYEKGRTFLALNQPEAATDAFTTALRYAPQQHETYYQRALAQYRLRRYEQAAADARQAYQLVPGYVPGALEEARALVQLSRYEQARTGLLALKGARKAVEEQFGKSTLAEVHYLLGRCEYELNQPKAALDAFDDALGLHPDWPAALIERGRTQDALGKPDRAQPDYEKALKIETSAATTYALATVLERRKKYDEALNRYAQCLQLDTDRQYTAEALLGRGRCLMEGEKYAPAAVELMKIGQEGSAPCTGECAYYRAYALVRSGRAEEALELTRPEVFRSTPDLAARLYYAVAAGHLARRQPEQAFEQLEKALQSGLTKEFLKKERLFDTLDRGFRKDRRFGELVGRYQR